MNKQTFRVLTKPYKSFVSLVILFTFLIAHIVPVLAMNSARGGALPQPLPLFPADNWWNLDISSWPVDPNSASYIAFINNGGTRRLHPDLGGDAATAGDPYAIYGMPYVGVSNVTNADLKAVEFLYADESDGFDPKTGVSFPFYPIPPEAITQSHWIEGGDPGNVDQRSNEDRHLLIVDYDRNYLYELYNVFYDVTAGKWFAGSGAFFDMNTNNRRPDTWTSADAAGLAILPGLVRYDEVYDSNVAEIGHAFRVTVRATNGYVYPASHRAGSTVGALPMGARLRLKSNIDVTQRTNDPNLQKIFRAMQKHGVIVADNGSDMYITGTYDTRWDNSILNPAFASLTASDFEVIQLGYNPVPVGSAILASLSVSPASVIGGQSATGSVTLSGPAPGGGAMVNLLSANAAATVPAAVTVPANATAAKFSVTTSVVNALSAGNITANYAGITKTTSLSVQPAPSVKLLSLTLNATTVTGGLGSVGTVLLSGPAPVGGVVVVLASSNPNKASVPATITVLGGSTSAVFNVTTATVKRKTVASITGSYGGLTKKAALTIKR
jgi:hypothetical protein